METEIFAKLGLSRGETLVYLALVKLREATITPIVNESKVTKSKIYDILQRLIDKGFVGYVVKNNVKHFVANDPHMILDYVDKKEEELQKTRSQVEQMIPELLLTAQESPEKRIAEIYEGYKGVRAIREELMLAFKEKDTLKVLGAPKVANEKWEGWFLDFHRRRIERKINMQIIYNANAQDYGEIRRKMDLTTVKYLPNQLVSPNWIDIFPDAVLFVLVLAKPIAFVVRDKQVADSMRSYFEIMWKQSLDEI